MKVQKALHLHIDQEKRSPKSAGRGYAMFEKYDGWFGYSTGGPIHSRAGRVIPAVAQLSKHITFGDKYKGTLIFEILLQDEIKFHILNGILNRKFETAKSAYIMCHDFVPEDDIAMPFSMRYALLAEVVRYMNAPKNKVQIAPVLGVSDSELTWRETAQEIWAKGGEGIILKATEAGYSPDKRNADLLKIKEEVTLDLLVVGMQHGAGKYADTLGTLIVRDKAGILHPVSGMTDTQRNRWWNGTETIIGKVVEVKAMKILKDGSLREPRFKAVRHDKTASEID